MIWIWIRRRLQRCHHCVPLGSSRAKVHQHIEGKVGSGKYTRYLIRHIFSISWKWIWYFWTKPSCPASTSKLKIKLKGHSGSVRTLAWDGTRWFKFLICKLFNCFRPTLPDHILGTGFIRAALIVLSLFGTLGGGRAQCMSYMGIGAR